jgi:cytochrome b561
MQLTNTKRTFGWVAILLHWIAGLGVIALFVIGFLAGRAEDAHDRAGHTALRQQIAATMRDSASPQT